MDHMTSLIVQHCGGKPAQTIKSQGNEIKYISHVDFDFEYIKKAV